MSLARRTILLLIVVFLAAIALFAVYDLVVPPFTDQEIKDSFVDTWKPYTSVTVFLLLVCAALGLSALLMSVYPPRPAWRWPVLTIGLSLVTITMLLVAHASFTQRVTALTGQTVGPLFGLF